MALTPEEQALAADASPKSPTTGGTSRLSALGRWLAASSLLAIVAFPPVAATDLLVISLAPFSDGLPEVGPVALSALLTLFAAGVLGLAQAPILALGAGLLRLLGPARAFRVALVGLVAVPTLGALWAVLAPGLDRVTEPDLRVTLQVTFVVLVATGAVLAGVVGAALVEPRLRRPGQMEVAGKVLAAVAVGVAIGFVAALWSRFHEAFTDAVPLAAGALFGLCEVAVLLAWSAVPALQRAVDRALRPTAVRVLLPLVAILAFGAAEAVTVADSSAAPWVASRNGAAGRVLSLLRGTWDLDGDGSSPVLGGGDCDDLDPFLFPTAIDEPGNGIDEDCNGEDALPGQAAALPTYALDPAEGHKYNLVFLCIDAFRADRASFLGYPRRTTPNIEALAKDSWVFENVVAPSSTTRESIPPLFSGRYPSGVEWEKEAKVRPLSATQRLLAEVLKAKGWQTIGVVDEWLKRFLPSALRGFDVAEVAYGQAGWKEFGQQAAPFTLFRSVELLSSRDRARPFFLYAHFEAPHYPYVRHDLLPTFGAQPSDLYDQEIAYADHYAGLLLEYLETQHLMDDTVIVIFGDHGEEFGEHGGKQHSRTLHVESVHVPLVIKIPGRTSIRVRTRVSLIDVFPTLMDVFGLRPDEPQPQGFSLFQYVEGRDPWPERPIFSELMVNNEGALKYRKAIYQGRFKLLWDMDSGSTQLYDLLRDPRERVPLSDPQAQDRLFQELKDFVARGDHHG